MLQEDITLDSPLPLFRSDIVIEGYGHHISGNNLFQVFVIEQGELSINDLHVSEGFTAENGGAISVRHGGVLIMHNSSIRESVAVKRGGAINVDVGQVRLTDSSIIGNYAEDGGGIAGYNASIDLIDSTVSDNVARDGGALNDYRVRLSLRDSAIKNNLAAEDGGGIKQVQGMLTIRHSILRNNRSSEQGGALDLSGVATTIDDSEISHNRAGTNGGALYFHGYLTNHLHIKNSTLSNNRAVERGAGIYASMGDLSVVNSTFSGNKVNGNGGALYSENSEVSVVHATIAYNEALNGGGIYARSSDVLTMRNSIVMGSVGGDCIGGLLHGSGNLIEDGACMPRVSGDPMIVGVAGTPGHYLLAANSPAIDRADPKFCPENDQIGTARPQGETCDISAIEALNSSETSDRNISKRASRSAIIVVAGDCNLSDAITAANSNRAKGSCTSGAGRDIIRLTDDVTLADFLPEVTSPIIIEGQGHTISGAQEYQIFSVHYGDLTLKNLTLTKGQSTSVWTDFIGGAIAVNAGKLTLVDCVVQNNIANHGGAIAAFGSDILVIDSVFDGNIADAYEGGAMSLRNSIVKIKRSVFSNNYAAEHGGAINVSSSSARFSYDRIVIKESSFSNNRVLGNGGGIYAGWTDIHLENITFQENEAETGGALYLVGQASKTLKNVKTVDNVTKNGGDIYKDQ